MCVNITETVRNHEMYLLKFVLIIIFSQRVFNDAANIYLYWFCTLSFGLHSVELIFIKYYINLVEEVHVHCTVVV